MQFTKRLRDGVRRGEITCSVRIWQSPHVKAGNRYRFGSGQIEVSSIEAIELADITPQLARESGFAGVVDLLKTAKHGPGTNVYLVRFRYVPPGKGSGSGASGSSAKQPERRRKPRAADAARKRIAALVGRLPEGKAVGSGRHRSLEVRKKRFGYFLDDHHGDGRLALNCKASTELRELLQHNAPRTFHVPKYLGAKGWIGLWLDVTGVDWGLVELALREAYALAAPKTLARQVTASS